MILCALTQETALNAILNPLQSKKNEDIRNEGTQQWRKPPQEGKMPSGKEEGGLYGGCTGVVGGGLGWPPVAIRKLTPLPALQAAWEVTLLLPSNSPHPAQTMNYLLRMRT